MTRYPPYDTSDETITLSSLAGLFIAELQRRPSTDGHHLAEHRPGEQARLAHQHWRSVDPCMVLIVSHSTQL